MAWEAFDRRGRKKSARSYLIRPEGFTIPKDAQKIHGISTLKAVRSGAPLSEALGDFLEAMNSASVLVAHNFTFDSAVIRAELYRLRMPGHNHFRRGTCVCTMRASTKYCAIPGRRGYKWPTLPELYRKLFGSAPRRAHDAASDTAACSKCFFELARRGIVRIPGPTNR